MDEERQSGKGPDVSPQSRLWPVWKLESGYAQLAQYVTPGAITGDPDLKARLSLDEQLNLDPDARDQVRAERLYEMLREEKIRFDGRPWASAEGVQQIRHPWWILKERFANCLDLTLLYAGMCLAANAGVLLALGGRHALAVLTPGRLHWEGAREEPFALDGFAEVSGDPGVFGGSGAALGAAIEGGAVALDLVELTRGASYEEAVGRAAGRWGPEEDLVLVDIPYLQALPGGDARGDFSELPHPASFRPAIRFRVPGGGARFRPFENHMKTIAELTGVNGMHALIGDGGRGKSTIARYLAEHAADGAAWFLDASDRAALSSSLAEAMFAEKPRAEHESLDDPAERKAMCETAKAYLATTSRPWLVVLDNADGDPATLRGLLPTPKPGQAILVTSINRQWVDVAGFTPHFLARVGAPDLGGFGEGKIAELIGGRPLLLEAFERLSANSSWDGRALPSPLPGVQSELVGPAAFWVLLQDVEEFDEMARDLAATAAYMPANGQPLAVLRRLVPGSELALERLVSVGLLALDRNAQEVRLHRLFGEAIRFDLEANEPGLCDRMVRRLTADPGAGAVFDEHGDLATVTRLEERLVAIDKMTAGLDRELGLCLHSVGMLLELHGHTRRSGHVLERAERHLTDPGLRADCLLGRARTVNQHHKDEPALLEEAIGWAREARELKLAARANGPAYRALAMEGLLMRPLAKFAEPGKPRDQLLDRAQEILEEADRHRQALPDQEVPPAEKARSHYNLAGVRIPKAQASPARAAEHLSVAKRIYEEVAARRGEIYDRMVHPHIAACINGLAIVAYSRATLLPADAQQRTTWLREATVRASEALKQRELLDGSFDADEATKSAALLAKIALARSASPPAKQSEDAGKVAGEAMDELQHEDSLPLRVPPLPRGREGLAEALEGWVRSEALKELVGAFGDPPPQDLDLAALLVWLDDFSDRWDFRSGERDIGEVAELPLEAREQVERAASALGLSAGGVDPRGHYDIVLILGGLARACISRPRYTAQIIAENELDVDRIVAVGAFRALSEGEGTLFESVIEASVDNEFEAMDRGVREAFGLAHPVSTSGEERENANASWRVNEYETKAGGADRSGCGSLQQTAGEAREYRRYPCLVGGRSDRFRGGRADPDRHDRHLCPLPAGRCAADSGSSS